MTERLPGGWVPSGRGGGGPCCCCSLGPGELGLLCPLSRALSYKSGIQLSKEKTRRYAPQIVSRNNNNNNNNNRWMRIPPHKMLSGKESKWRY